MQQPAVLVEAISLDLVAQILPNPLQIIVMPAKSSFDTVRFYGVQIHPSGTCQSSAVGIAVFFKVVEGHANVCERIVRLNKVQ